MTPRTRRGAKLDCMTYNRRLDMHNVLASQHLHTLIIRDVTYHYSLTCEQIQEACGESSVEAFRYEEKQAEKQWKS